MYTIHDGVRDGMLVELDPSLCLGLVSHVTRGVWDAKVEGALFLGEGGVDLGGLLRLAHEKIATELGKKPEEWLVTGLMHEGRGYWAQLNELGKWTLMLAGEY